MQNNYTDTKNSPLKRLIVNVLFSSKWILTIFYFGLIVAQVLYSIKFAEEIYHLCHAFSTITENGLMLIVLSLIDITMIAGLIKMIITGSYQSYIEKVSDDGEKVSSSGLKVKLGSSLVGVSSIHLLQSFINAEAYTDRDLIVKASFHLIFLLSTIGLAWVDYLHTKTKEH